MQQGMPQFSCSKPVAATTAEQVDSVDGIQTRNPSGALILRTAATAWCRNTDPPGGYVYSEASVAAPDGLTVIIPLDALPALPGRWLRLVPPGGIVTPQDFYLASLAHVPPGNDANDGLTPATPILTIARLQVILPPEYDKNLRVHFLDAGPFTIPNGSWALPDASGGARPMQLLGVYAEDPAGGGGGVRTIAALGVGTDTIKDAAGGLTPGFYKGFVARRTGGAGTWRRYFITDNTADTFVLALPWVNGGTPVVGDTFVVERATAEIDYDNTIMDTNGTVIIADGLLFVGTGPGLKRLIWTNSGVLYPQGCRDYGGKGRFGFEGASVRTFDLVEGTFDGTSRYPVEMPDQLGIFVSDGDFYGEGGGKNTLSLVTGAVAFQAGPGPYPGAPTGNVDLTCGAGSSFTILDGNTWVDSACVPRDSGSIEFDRSNPVNSRSRLSTTNGGIFANDGGLLRLSRTDIHDCSKFAGLADGAFANDGGLVLLSNMPAPSGPNSGFGTRQQLGGDIINISGPGTNALTGALGDIGVSVPGFGSQAITWAQFDARLGTTRRNALMTKPAAEGFLQNNRAFQSLVENLAALEAVTNSTTARLDAASVQGLVAWWMASAGRVMTVGGGTVERWIDQTYNQWQPSQPTSVTAPTFVARAAEVANEAALDFDGINNRLFLSGDFTPLSVTGYTMFYVSRVDTPATTNYLFRESAALAAAQDTNIRYQYVGGGEGHYANVTATPLIVHAVYDGTLVGDANRLKVYESNVQQVLVFGGAIPASISGTGDLTIGAFDDVPNFPFNGRFYEIVIYNRPLTIAEQLLVYTYLKNKFGL